MRISRTRCVWVRLCGSGSRFQFRVGDFRPRTQTVFCGQEFCGFKLTFRFCNFLDVNFQDFVWKFFLAEEVFLIPENGTYISAPPEMRRNAEIRRVSGDPVRMESIFSFQAGGAGGGSPPLFSYLNMLFNDALVSISNFCNLYYISYIKKKTLKRVQGPYFACCYCFNSS